jgi:hypothetical protein
MTNNHLKQFAQIMADEIKKSARAPAPSKIVTEEAKPIVIENNKETNMAIEVSKYLSRPKETTEDIKTDHSNLINSNNDNIPAASSNIEAQRWNDPLKNTDFVTKKEMNDHYGLFLQRIQQQMSTMGGGGEVNLRGLDDVITSSTGTNKFLTYNPTTRKFYFDFINPATESTIGGIIPGAGFTVDVDGTLSLNAGPMFELDESDVFQLKAGTTNRIGGIKAGPGVAIDPDGTLFIDSEGVPFTFGNFTGLVGTYSSNTAYALLGSINEDEDIVIASNGDGGVKVVGAFEIHATNGTVTGSLETEPFFKIKDDGQVRILVPLADTQEGGMEIIGSDLGTSLLPGIAGTMLHMTGNADLPTRVYHDTLGEYSSYVFRRYNGSVITPTQVLSGEDIGRINWTAATDAGMGNVALAQLSVTALENQSTTAQGSSITLTVTPVGATASNRVDALVIKGTGIELPTAGTTVKLSGSTSGTTTIQASAIAGTTAITLPATTGTVITTGDTGTVTNTMLAGSIANAKLANSTISGTALGSNLAALTISTYLTGTSYNGSTAATIAVDATTAATASKVVARDVNGDIAATGTILATRDAGSFGAGQTITIDMATDHYVHATVTSATVTVAYTNITAGKQVMIFFTNSTGADIAVNSGLATTNCTNAKAVENTKHGGTSRFGAVSFGTSTATMYGNWEK